jgi:hypothetical protein
VIFSRGQTIYRGGDKKEPEPGRRNRRNNKNNGSVIYPIFEEASRLTDDPSWESILKDASKGVFPRMYRYNGDVLSFKQKSKVHTKEICLDDPALCLRNVQEFMRNMGLYSERDQYIRLREMEAAEEEVKKPKVRWKQIKSDKTKNVLISKYISLLERRYTLDNMEITRLANVVRMANSIGMVNANTVSMRNGQIVDISPLCFNSKTRNFFIDPATPIPKMTKIDANKLETKLDSVEEKINIKSKVGNTTISISRSLDWEKFWRNWLEESLGMNLERN